VPQLARSPQRPIGVAQKSASHENQIRLAFREDLLHLFLCLDQAHGGGSNSSLATNSLGKGTW